MCVAVKKQFDQRVYDNKKISSDKTATKISINSQKKRWKYGLRLNKTYDGNQKLISHWKNSSKLHCCMANCVCFLRVVIKCL